MRRLKWNYGPCINWREWKGRTVKISAVTIIAAAVVTTSLATMWPSAVPPAIPLPPAAKQAEETAMPQVKAASVVSQIRTHTVIAGETLQDIAATYHIDVDTLLSANPDIGELIHPGDRLVVLPQRGILHIVEPGDTSWGISSQYAVAAEIIMKANNKNDEQLFVSDKIFVPGGRYRAVNAISRAVVSRFIWPTLGEFSSPYGYRWGRLHTGIDIANDLGTPIRAARAGRVVSAGWQSGYGYTVVIEHGNDYSTLYAHLDNYAVSIGQYVQTGQFIAHMGNTGISTGSHLHFEVRVDGKPVNPMSYLN